jgi:hypothetical protein
MRAARNRRPVSFFGTEMPQEPLPSWNDGAAKSAILDVAARATKEGGPDYGITVVSMKRDWRAVFDAGEQS